MEVTGSFRRDASGAVVGLFSVGELDGPYIEFVSLFREIPGLGSRSRTDASIDSTSSSLLLHLRPLAVGIQVSRLVS